jgi:hypothetical protein
VLALRIFDAGGEQVESFGWGDHRITPGEWYRVERARGDFA